MTRAELLRELKEAPTGEQSAVIAGASTILDSLEAVYALLDGETTTTGRATS
jgi:hypothetical protein